MELKTVNRSDEELERLDESIDEMTRTMVDKLDELKPGEDWYPIMVYSVFNVITILNEMSRRSGGDSDLEELTYLFCNGLTEAVKEGSMLEFKEVGEED